MIIQGLKLSVLGMGVVFCFLILLMILIHICAKLVSPRPQKTNPGATVETPEMPKEKNRRTRP